MDSKVNSNWYIFWVVRDNIWLIYWKKRRVKSKNILEIWCGLKPAIRYTYPEVKSILKNNMISKIPYSKNNIEFLRRILKQWIKDVDYYYDCKTIYRKCTTCGKKLKIKIYKDGKYEGAVYFGKLEIPDSPNFKIIRKEKDYATVEFKRYKNVEFWECYDCAKMAKEEK